MLAQEALGDGRQPGAGEVGQLAGEVQVAVGGRHVESL